MTNSSQNQFENFQSSSPEDGDRYGLLFLIALSGWFLLITVFAQVFSWILEQLSRSVGANWPDWLWAFITGAQAILLIAPSSIFAIFWQGKHFRPAFRTLFIASIYCLIVVPIRLIQPTNLHLVNLSQVLVNGLVCLVLILVHWKRKRQLPHLIAGHKLLLGLAVTAISVYPWLAWGALGSILDTLLNLTAGISFGACLSLIIGLFLLDPQFRSGFPSQGSLLRDGFIVSVALVVVTSAFGYGGMQLPLMAIGFSSGWIIVLLWGNTDSEVKSEGWLNLQVYIGLSVAIPMTLIDPNELILVLSLDSRDLLVWVGYASILSLIICLVISFILSFAWQRIQQRMRRLIFVGSTSVLWLLGLGIYLFVGQPGFYGDGLFVILRNKADLALAHNIPDFEGRKRVIYDELTSFAQEDQQELRSFLDKLGVDYKGYYLVNAIEVDDGPIIRTLLSNREDVDRVLKIPRLRPLPANTPKVTGSLTLPKQPLWNLVLIGADRVWEKYGVTGKGIIVGQSDTGIEKQHPELKDNYRGAMGEDDYNWYDPWNGSTSPEDIAGHGTHTLATAVGQNVGVAPGSQWIACVNLARNLANPAFYLDCLQFMFAPFPIGRDPFQDGNPSLSAHVLNNSWGCPEMEGCDSDVLLDAVEALRLAGIFVVSAAGNEGPGCESVAQPLALYDEVFTVGAIDQEGELASFSSLGPVTVDGSGRLKPDVSAPGVDVLSAFPGGTYESLQGTSMASPHVAGTVALMWSANPALIGDIEHTEAILRGTAREYPGVIPDCVNSSTLPNNAVGYGVLDAYAAVEAALAFRD